jgi:hypothetical protein
MAFLDNLKQKAKELSTQGAEFAKNTAEKAQTLAKIAKLKTENELDKNAINKLYAVIGKTFYEENPGAVTAPQYEQSFTEIVASFARIAARNDEIETQKTVEAEVEDVVEDAVEDAAEAVSDAAETVADAAETIQETVE